MTRKIAGRRRLSRTSLLGETHTHKYTHLACDTHIYFMAIGPRSIFISVTLVHAFGFWHWTGPLKCERSIVPRSVSWENDLWLIQWRVKKKEKACRWNDEIVREWWRENVGWKTHNNVLRMRNRGPIYDTVILFQALWDVVLMPVCLKNVIKQYNVYIQCYFFIYKRTDNSHNKRWL